MGAKSSSHRHSYPYGNTPAWATSPTPSYASNYTESEVTSRSHGRYSRIADNYNSLDQVTAALAQAGLESSNLIVGIDFTKSNEWTGARSFNRRSLHHISDSQNPYEQAISIIGRTLSAFDEDDLIPCFGFGDASTHDQEVFSFFQDERSCNGFEEALSQYREIVPHLKLAGPTSFAPIIETAIGIVEKSGGQYHVLLIIADGQVTRSVDTDPGHLSPQERDTINAIVKASDYPLSIVLVGVGDGPWDMMRQFDDNIPSRAFDNFQVINPNREQFRNQILCGKLSYKQLAHKKEAHMRRTIAFYPLQFVNFTEIMARSIPSFKKETEFALAALMEIPSQYKATLELQLLGRRRGTPARVALPPPIRNNDSANSSSRYSRSSSFEQSGVHNPPSAPPPEISQRNNQVCPVCLWNAKDFAFGCGHQTCYDCGRDLVLCPICRSYITTRIRLY